MPLKVTAKHYKLKLKYPFTTSRYTVTEQDTVIVGISDGSFTGYGEATANPYYGSSVNKIVNSIKEVQNLVEAIDHLDPEKMWYQLEPKLQHNYFALCAIDCALWDLFGKQKSIKLHQYWSGNKTINILSSYTIGIDSIEKMISKIKENPWPIYKIKLGTPQDIKIISEIRKITDSVIRIDANCAWSAIETINNASELKKLNVEFIEQPLAADQWNINEQVASQSVLPIIADESCQKLEDIEKCVGHFNGINIKLMKCGGLTPALKMIELAKERNLRIMAGCMTESTVGISNLLQLSPLLDYLDADGALLLKNDIASGALVKRNGIQFSETFGSGIEID